MKNSITRKPGAGKQWRSFWNRAGLRLLAVYGEGSREEPGKDCERMYFVASESGKENKIPKAGERK